MATMAANFIVPKVVELVSGKNSETPDDDSSPISSLFGLVGGGSSKEDDGIMGKLGGFFS